MSTRSFVYVKIKEEDKGTKKKADLIKVNNFSLTIIII